MCAFGQFGCDAVCEHTLQFGSHLDTDCYVYFWTIWLWQSVNTPWHTRNRMLCVLLDNLAVTQSVNTPCSLDPTWTQIGCDAVYEQTAHSGPHGNTKTENCVHLNNKLENGVPVSACVCERKDSAHLTVLATAGVEAPPLLQLQLVIRVFTHLVLWCAVTDLKSQAPSEPAVARKTDPVFPQTVQWTVVMLLKQTHRANQPY